MDAKNISKLKKIISHINDDPKLKQSLSNLEKEFQKIYESTNNITDTTKTDKFSDVEQKIFKEINKLLTPGDLTDAAIELMEFPKVKNFTEWLSKVISLCDKEQLKNNVMVFEDFVVVNIDIGRDRDDGYYIMKDAMRDMYNKKTHEKVGDILSKGLHKGSSNVKYVNSEYDMDEYVEMKFDLCIKLESDYSDLFNFIYKCKGK